MGTPRVEEDLSESRLHKEATSHQIMSIRHLCDVQIHFVWFIIGSDGWETLYQNTSLQSVINVFETSMVHCSAIHDSLVLL